MSEVSLGSMADRARFEDSDSLKDFCAEQLHCGSLAIVLGAGASMGFGLPSWPVLTQRLCDKVSLTRPEGRSEEDVAEEILAKKCNGDDVIFATEVREALYREYDIDPDQLSSNRLLRAIGALTMSSARGSAASVVSFNFDDLLELFLRYYGNVVQSVAVLPTWQGRSDITVYHPHGLLPSDFSTNVENGIVMAQIHFDRVVGNTVDLWHNVLLNIFRSHTCLFVGLSGDDKNLKSLLAKTEDAHASSSKKHAFWGVRFSIDGNEQTTWETRGVFNLVVDDYDCIPTWLFEICQRAADRSPVVR